MRERKNIEILIGFVLSVSLLSVSVTAAFLTEYHNRIRFRVLGNICQKIIEDQPAAEQAVLTALKEYSYESADYAGESIMADENVIWQYGYRSADFLLPADKYGAVFAAVGFGAGGTLFLMTLLSRRKKKRKRIEDLTEYLEQINTGGADGLFRAVEDDFSKLQDEIYKTVTALYQTREAALRARADFAQNLYNIAHQIKTPITAISLSVQMMDKDLSPKYPEQIRRQLLRLTHLEESLLLLARLDAGAFVPERKKVDVLTLLTLSAENLQELFRAAEVSVEIPESGEIIVSVDLEWTMEAVMNLLKNCMEHTPRGGIVRCAYEQNLLYTRIRIWDSGAGFSKEDLPHLFERFYRGKNEKKEGVGIGLAISRAVVESQNGTLSAENLSDGGACFEIRFYAA